MKNEKTMPLFPIVGYENIKMYQPSDAFRMTSDALSLANFVKFKYTDKKVLDIGTGLGGIPLILSSKKDVQITGVEIEKKIADIALRSVKYNHLEDRIEIVNQNIKDYASKSVPHVFDIIVSNPPYYALKDGYTNLSSVIQTAKHDTTLQLEDVLKVSNKLLKDNGKLMLVFTTDRLLEVIDLFQKYHFAVKRLQFIHGEKSKDAKTFLIEGSKNGKSGTRVCPPIVFQ